MTYNQIALTLRGKALTKVTSNIKKRTCAGIYASAIYQRREDPHEKADGAEMSPTV